METYRVKTTVSQDGKLSIKGLPFRAGEKVEVIASEITPYRKPKTK